METIEDALPADIAQNIALLKEDLDLKIPPKKLEKNLLIATWNIRGFGDITRKWKSAINDSPKRDFHSLVCIAEIIKRFDVIAIQEVKSNLKGLRDVLKVLGNDWSLILTDVNQGDVGNGERMAYLFDTRRVNLSGLACELVVPDEWTQTIPKGMLNKQFVRSPYAVSFRSQNQTFILVTLHILYGKTSTDRITELKGIAKWLSSWADDINAYHQNLITLGDFNIDERGDLLNNTFISEGMYIPPALQNSKVTRSIFDETKYYDQIAWFQDSNKKNNISLEFITGGNYDFLNTTLINRNLTKQAMSFMMSDHFPLWAEFKL
ncbi:endonuclease/exonuclease/phosphatase family protein [Flavobacterium granuli]|uniref:Endonuclease/exonuclease/phosphatase family metal-dependent hydrolase n=1 Tax=Flavobacterium granuli TaxID=280093 RepID=A0ABU1RX61_9FLAO|nr:endonuclease/exonuclease/phosphatase family protein [Flavobacterium granuli]MDR6843362.1 endonuclease/exonuclease/phosphatase family metal-dependent hydrolase [Flavobacterium granuli]